MTAAALFTEQAVREGRFEEAAGGIPRLKEEFERLTKALKETAWEKYSREK